MDHFEDLDPGDAWAAGETTLTEAEIVEFASQYDPQPMHVDAEAAAEAGFDGVIASGWHTAAACMRVLVDGVLDGIATGPALGVDELRWRTPVRPGDTLRVEAEIVDTGPWNRKFGLVRIETVATTSRDGTALEATPLVLVRRADASDG